MNIHFSPLQTYCLFNLGEIFPKKAIPDIRESLLISRIIQSYDQ